MKSYELPKEILDAFRRNRACKEACEEVVLKAIHHSELCKIEHDELWREVISKLCLDRKITYHLDVETGIITGHSVKEQDPEIAEQANILERKIAAMKQARDLIKKASWGE